MKLQNPVKNARLLKYPAGQIYQLFGENPELYQRAIGIKAHNGIDIVAPFRTPIIAAKGEIVEVKNTPEGYGKHIRLLTDPIGSDYYELVFGHLDEIPVKVGDRTEDGQEIGLMGNTGFIISNSTPFWGNAPAGRGIHLHFGVRECSLKNTGWRTTYSSGRRAYIKDYENGYSGYVDPTKFLDLPDDYVEYVLGILKAISKKIEDLFLKVGKIN